MCNNTPGPIQVPSLSAGGNLKSGRARPVRTGRRLRDSSHHNPCLAELPQCRRFPGRHGRITTGVQAAQGRRWPGGGCSAASAAGSSRPKVAPIVTLERLVFKLLLVRADY